jgi:uncharacterized protein YggU (UPF0235/DUF167 family)
MMRVSVKAYPGARKEGVTEEHGIYKVSVNVAPENGKANKRICELIAEHLGVRKSAVSVVQGETSRQKVLEIVT